MTDQKKYSYEEIIPLAKLIQRERTKKALLEFERLLKFIYRMLLSVICLFVGGANLFFLGLFYTSLEDNSSFVLTIILSGCMAIILAYSFAEEMRIIIMQKK